MGELLDVVHQGVKLPLPVNLATAAQGEAVHSLGVADVAEGRLHRTQTFAVDRPSFGAVDLGLHRRSASGFRRLFRVLVEKHHLAGRLLICPAQATDPQFAVLASRLRISLTTL